MRNELQHCNTLWIYLRHKIYNKWMEPVLVHFIFKKWLVILHCGWAIYRLGGCFPYSSLKQSINFHVFLKVGWWFNQSLSFRFFRKLDDELIRFPYYQFYFFSRQKESGRNKLTYKPSLSFGSFFHEPWTRWYSMRRGGREILLHVHEATEWI